jgi:hypothetical protein
MATQTNFGKWIIDTERGILKFTDPNKPRLLYNIPLWEISQSSKMLDWIFQIAEKTWAKPEDLYDLIQAFEYIFGRGMCSGGIDHPFNPKEFLAKKFGNKS